LHRPPDQPDQSYSERQMYEAAMSRLALELALVEKIELEAATAKLVTMLIKTAPPPTPETKETPATPES